MPSVLVCSECGAPLPPGRLICSACGATVTAHAAIVEPREDGISPEELAAADAALAGDATPANEGEETGIDEPSVEQVEQPAVEPTTEPGVEAAVEPELPVEPTPEAEPTPALEPAAEPPAAEPVEAEPSVEPSVDAAPAIEPEPEPELAAEAPVEPEPEAPPAVEPESPRPVRTPGAYVPPSAGRVPAYRAPIAAYAAAPAAAVPATEEPEDSRPDDGHRPTAAAPVASPTGVLAVGPAPAAPTVPRAAAAETLRELGTFGLVAAGGSLAIISLFLPWASETGVVIGLLPAYKPEKWGWAAPVAIPMLVLTLAVVGLATLADRYEARLGRAAHAVNVLHEVVLPLLLAGVYLGVALVCVLQPFGFGAGIPVLLLAALFTFAGGAVSLFVGTESTR